MGTPQRTGDIDLASLALDNEIELWAHAVAVMPGGRTGRENGVGWFVSGLPVAAFNQVHAMADVAPTAIARAVAIVRERGVPFQVRLRDGRRRARAGRRGARPARGS